MNEFAGLAALLAFVVAVAAPAAIGQRVLGPLDRAARGGRHRTQFQVSDFLALVFQLQVPLAVAFGMRAGMDHRSTIPIAALLCIAVLLMWSGGIRAMSRAGVRDPRRRNFFIAIILPATFLAALALAPMVMASIVMLITTGLTVATGCNWLITISLPFVLYGCSRAIRWILSEENQKQAVQVEDPLA